ncbi:MAG TPA: hypothetical protein VGO43_07085 [Pyrinomonadaceae bacterium]|jgi:hypothetical protein|nr:hypothetical protein [Pyrinomonadaceae bacterium]
MRKLVFAIAMVFCLQISFQVYMAIERSNADYAILGTGSSLESETAPTIDLAKLHTDLVTSVAETEYRAGVSSSRRSHSAPSATQARYNRPRAIPQTNTTAKWKPIEITYTKPAASETAKFSGGHKASTREPDEKRSFFAKALPIIKKPYDWLKAVGSKLR